MVDGLFGVAVLRLHDDGFEAGALHPQRQRLGAHVGHVGAACAQGFDDGVVVAGLDLLHLTAQHRAEILGQTVAGVGRLGIGFVGGVGDGEHAVLPTGVAGLGGRPCGGGRVAGFRRGGSGAAAGQQAGGHQGGQGQGKQFPIAFHTILSLSVLSIFPA